MTTTTFTAEGAKPIPQGSALTDMTKQQVLPEWYTNYAMDILAGQKAISSRDYVKRPMDRVAAFTDPQNKSFTLTDTAAGAYQPYLSQAETAAKAAAAGPGALNTAQPYLSQAGQTSVANINQYMNPYNDAVTNRIAEMGTRNLTENILPQIEGRYIQAGQLGYGARDGAGTPSGMMTDTSRAVRDTSADILAQQTAALQSGYNQAAGLAGTDLSRFGTLANTAGNMAQSQTQQQLAAAGALSNLGEQAQTLGLTGAGALGNIGALQQQQGQKNLDVAYEEFLRQQGYDQEQLDKMMATFKGVATGVPSADRSYGISPIGSVDTSKTSTGSDIAAILAALSGFVGGGKP